MQGEKKENSPAKNTLLRYRTSNCISLTSLYDFIIGSSSQHYHQAIFGKSLISLGYDQRFRFLHSSVFNNSVA